MNELARGCVCVNDRISLHTGYRYTTIYSCMCENYHVSGSLDRAYVLIPFNRSYIDAHGFGDALATTVQTAAEASR